MYLEDRMVRLQLWDTAGQERFRSLIPSYIRDSSVAVIVYDVANRQSFLNTNKWVEEVRQELGSDVIIVLVGNKTDLLDKRQVSTEEGDAKSHESGIMFLETSAKAGFNIKCLFLKIASNLKDLHINLDQDDDIFSELFGVMSKISGGKDTGLSSSDNKSILQEVKPKSPAKQDKVDSTSTLTSVDPQIILMLQELKTLLVGAIEAWSRKDDLNSSLSKILNFNIPIGTSNDVAELLALFVDHAKRLFAVQDNLEQHRKSLKDIEQKGKEVDNSMGKKKERLITVDTHLTTATEEWSNLQKKEEHERQLAEVKQNKLLLRGPLRKLKDRRKTLDQEISSMSTEKTKLDAQANQVRAAESQQIQDFEHLAEERHKLDEELDQLLKKYGK